MTNYLQQKTLYLPQIRTRVTRNLGLCVVIPVYLEPYLLRTLMSLKKCELPTFAVEVIVVLYNSENTSEEILEKNRAIYLQALDWSKKNLQALLKFHILFHDDLPKLFSNDDLAIKIGMDEAAFRLEKAKKKRGIITTINANCKVEKNYLTALEAHFRRRKVPRVCQVNYAFPLEGIDFEDKIYEAITNYELHLRYCDLAAKFLKIENKIENTSVGFAVDNDTYQKKGGWNSVIGKSDLQKSAFSLKTTTVFPVLSIFNPARKRKKDKKHNFTYNPQSFLDLKLFFEKNGTAKEVILSKMIDCPESIQVYFKEIDFLDCQLEQDLKTFFCRYHLMAFLEFVHVCFFKKVAVLDAVKILAGKEDYLEYCAKDLLLELRGEGI